MKSFANLTATRERIVSGCDESLSIRLYAYMMPSIYRAARFDVPLPFILQQAAWLYERQLSQVRDQMRRVGKGGGNEFDRITSASPQLGTRVSEHVGAFDGTASGVYQRQITVEKAAQKSSHVRDEESASSAKRTSGKQSRSTKMD